MCRLSSLTLTNAPGETMDWWWKTLFAMLSALVVLEAARRCGNRAAGALAALPTTTAPALAWIAFDHGTPLAVDAAIGSVAACAMLAAFALGYGHAARHGGSLCSLACGLAAAFALAGPAFGASSDLGLALGLALSCTALALASWPASHAGAMTSGRRQTPALRTAVAIGALAALAATLGPSLGGFMAGLLASLPLVTGPLTMIEHARRGHHAASEFLRGYVRGLVGKAIFGVVFALLAAHLGVASALLVAAAGAVLVTLPMRSLALRAIPTLRWRRAALPDAIAPALTPARPESYTRL